MKIQDVKQKEMPEARSFDEWINSIKNGKFTKHGRNITTTGNIKLFDSGLTSLVGMPSVISGNLDLARIKVETCEGMPMSVQGFVSLTHCERLTSLEGFPTYVGGSIDLSYCKNLKSLKGIPNVLLIGLDAYHAGLKTLKDGPESVSSGVLQVSYNFLPSLEGCPRRVYRLVAKGNAITSLKDIHKMIDWCQEIELQENPIQSHILGLLLIDGLEKVSLDIKKMQDIINSYLPNKRGKKAVMECQSELLDAGFESWAAL